jgi:hypothetical protein
VCFLTKFYKIFKKEIGKAKGYMGAREFFFCRGGCICIKKPRVESKHDVRDNKDKISKRKIVLRLGIKSWRMDFHKT